MSTRAERRWCSENRILPLLIQLTGAWAYASVKRLRARKVSRREKQRLARELGIELKPGER